MKKIVITINPGDMPKRRLPKELVECLRAKKAGVIVPKKLKLQSRERVKQSLRKELLNE
ncbi:hypothetical protein ISS03_01695 [Patescibacteria group bacterium]|nr:hypothetical protein [Patescibacteria group bacterium]